MNFERYELTTDVKNEIINILPTVLFYMKKEEPKKVYGNYSSVNDGTINFVVTEWGYYSINDDKYKNKEKLEALTTILEENNKNVSRSKRSAEINRVNGTCKTLVKK